VRCRTSNIHRSCASRMSCAFKAVQHGLFACQTHRACRKTSLKREKFHSNDTASGCCGYGGPARRDSCRVCVKKSAVHTRIILALLRVKPVHMVPSSGSIRERCPSRYRSERRSSLLPMFVCARARFRSRMPQTERPQVMELVRGLFPSTGMA